MKIKSVTKEQEIITNLKEVLQKKVTEIKMEKLKLQTVWNN